MLEVEIGNHDKFLIFLVLIALVFVALIWLSIS